MSEIKLLDSNIFFGALVFTTILAFIMTNLIVLEFIGLINCELIEPLMSLVMVCSFVILWWCFIALVYNCLTENESEKQNRG